MSLFFRTIPVQALATKELFSFTRLCICLDAHDQRGAFIPKLMSVMKPRDYVLRLIETRLSFQVFGP